MRKLVAYVEITTVKGKVTKVVANDARHVELWRHVGKKAVNALCAAKLHGWHLIYHSS